ncbi:MAG: hypothetical protein FJX78_08035 [Armatimonadetes bacterium]|nr:hypothetical protein [Armatimonadota bacterium]
MTAAPRQWEESFETFGQRFRFMLRGPVGDPARWEVSLATLAGEAIFPQAIRGKTEDEARWRAEQSLRNWIAMRRLHAACQRAADRVAPGATVVLHERATEVRVDLAGGWNLREPFRLHRDETLDESRAEADWEAWVEAHLSEHCERLPSP